MSADLRRTLIGVGVGTLLVVGLMVAAEIAPVAGLAVIPVLFGVLLWGEGWTIRSAAVLVAVIVIAFVVARTAA